MLSRYDSETVVKAIDLFRCTVWQSITTINVAVVNFPDIGRYDLRCLRRCASGGAPVPEEILKNGRELVGTELVECYGLSEAISQTHVNPVSRPRYGSIGIPHFDVDCRIVDVASGYSVFPAEVEASIYEHPAVEEVAV